MTEPLTPDEVNDLVADGVCALSEERIQARERLESIRAELIRGAKALDEAGDELSAAFKQLFAAIIESILVGGGTRVMAAEIKKRIFITHIGHVTVNNYGSVEFETRGLPSIGVEPEHVIWHADTVRELHRSVQEAISEMRKAGEYVR